MPTVEAVTLSSIQSPPSTLTYITATNAGKRHGIFRGIDQRFPRSDAGRPDYLLSYFGSGPVHNGSSHNQYECSTTPNSDLQLRSPHLRPRQRAADAIAADSRERGRAPAWTALATAAVTADQAGNTNLGTGQRSQYRAHQPGAKPHERDLSQPGAGRYHQHHQPAQCRPVQTDSLRRSPRRNWPGQCHDRGAVQAAVTDLANALTTFSQT